MAKTVIVTGSSRGIGRACALKFASCGFNVVLNSLHGGEKLAEAVIEAEKLAAPFGAKVYGTAGDVGDPVFARSLVNEAANRFGRIDVLVNNAGTSHIGLIQDMSDEEWQKVIASDLSSVHYCSSAVIGNMLANGSGHIVNISSVWGNTGASCEVAYSAAKGGVNTYTKALAKELAPSGIAVNAIACGAVDTDMNRCFSDEEIKELCDEIPAGRMCTPEEVAELVFMLSEQSVYLTGQIITMDGGWT